MTQITEIPVAAIAFIQSRTSFEEVESNPLVGSCTTIHQMNFLVNVIGDDIRQEIELLGQPPTQCQCLHAFFDPLKQCPKRLYNCSLIAREDSTVYLKFLFVFHPQ
jgi:hypothetical protein